MAHGDRRLKLVLPGGSGHLGRLLAEHFATNGHDVVVVGRGEGGPLPTGARFVPWSGRWSERSPSEDPGEDPGEDPREEWAREIDGADAVINLAGRSVDCRYDKTNLEEMLSSRIDSTVAVGRAIEAAGSPPPVWLQMSTATIYAHDPPVPQDEATGAIGGGEPTAPAYWRFSVRIAEAWERALRDAKTPSTRRVAMRTAVVMSGSPGGAYAILRRLARVGLGGTIGDGSMYMSWIHEVDFVRAIDRLLEDDAMEGVVNLAAPEPVPQRSFMRALRRSLGAPLGLPQPRWLVELGARLLGTDSELVLKSRRVVPGRLAEAGFEFRYPRWDEAARALASG
ncbi:MAG: TIGR01777 family oxidoreductase [Planctomycetota bacterium]